jgi:hypothetical protein
VTLLILLAFACKGSSADSDTDVAVEEPRPLVDIRDTRWWLPADQYLPDQPADWCADIYLARFPDYEGCFGEVVSCKQGLWFEYDRDAWKLFELVAESCTDGAPQETHFPMSDFGRWEWEGLATDGDLYRVNAERWTFVAQDQEETQVRVMQGDHSFVMFLEDASTDTDAPADTDSSDTDASR